MKKRNILYLLGGFMMAAGVATIITANSTLFEDDFDIEHVCEIDLDDEDYSDMVDDDDSDVVPNDPKVAKELGYGR